MRFIDTSTFIPPPNWDNEVNTALQTYNERQIFRAIWRDLIVPLNQILGFDGNSARKCWYSEVIIVGADGIDVDHFRPKSNVKKLTNKFANLDGDVWDNIFNIDRIGYHFLAFEWTNFRLASQHSNQGRVDGNFTKGKQDFFPLNIANPSIAMTVDELNTEENCLLDPCNENDPELLKFDASGQVDASYPVGTWEYCRAKVSIEVYHLNFDLKGLTGIRLTHWQRVEREINQLSILYFTLESLNQNGSDILENLIAGIRVQENTIFSFINKSEQFSAVAIDCIRHNMAEYGWLENLFNSEQLRK